MKSNHFFMKLNVIFSFLSSENNLKITLGPSPPLFTRLAELHYKLPSTFKFWFKPQTLHFQILS